MSELTFQEIKNKFLEYGCTIISEEKDYKDTKSVVSITDGTYKGICIVGNVLYKRPMFKRQWFSSRNPYLKENIQTFLKIEKDDNFKLKSDVGYKGFNRNTILDFECKRCGEIIKMSLFNARRKSQQHKGLTCPYCDGTLESQHALVLKQLFLRWGKDVIPEDKSCINPYTGAILPTDIVDHGQKIAIEVQSELHLRPAQKERDKIKKEYWINRGYAFYDYFIEGKTVLEYCQLFFPELKEIPKWAKTNIANKLNYKLIQKYLDQGHSVQETALFFNVNIHRIYDSLHFGNLHYPDNYYDRYKTPIVQLDKRKNYIAQYSCYAEASEKTGILRGNIISCINSKYYYANGFYWIPLHDYETGNYSINSRLQKYYLPVNVYDTKDNYLFTCDDLYEAKNKTNVPAFIIMDIIKGVRGSRYGYKFKYA